MAFKQSCNTYQTQAGTLKLRTSSQVKLFALPSHPVPGKRTRTSRRFKGVLGMVNNGKQFVAYKIMIMSKMKKYLSLRPSYGCILPNENLALDVYAKNISAINQSLSVLILATSCAVTDESMPADLSSFWKRIISGGSKSFVEVFEIENFQFFNSDGISMMRQSEEEGNESTGSASSSSSFNNNQYESSGSRAAVSRSSSLYTLSSYFQPSDPKQIADDSDASGDRSQTMLSNGRGGADNRAKLNKFSALDMKELSKRRCERHKFFRSYNLLCVMFPLFVIFLTCMSINSRKHGGSIASFSEQQLD